MADNLYTADAINGLTGLLAGAIEAQATRPQKTSVITNTTTRPYALQNIIANRDRIGQATSELNDALKAREGLGYTLASALAGIPQQQGTGSWLSDFARAFGGGMAAPTNAMVDRAQKKYEAEMKDLANILAYDKAMGDNQYQTQTIGYEPMEYGTAGKGQGAGGAGVQQQVPIINPNYWEQMIANFDKARPTEADYRGNQVLRKIENATLFAGDKDEAYARQQFNLIKGKNFLPIARNTLKGSGPITDFEDKKYTDWLNAANDPVALKDTAKMIVDDVAIKNNWTQSQKANALESLGLTSMETELLPQQTQYEPERVKSEENSIDSILQKYGAKRVD